MNVLVTGAKGFVGRNLCDALSAREGLLLVEYDLHSPAGVLDEGLRHADVIFHLAGVNRPGDPAEYEAVNAGFTREICESLLRAGRSPVIVLASSIQAELDNPYGRSKRAAEEAVRNYCDRSGATGVIHRLKNLFGKWCRPNYNSVTATFCHNIAHGLPIQISDPGNRVDLTYIDDVIAAFLQALAPPGEKSGCHLAPPLPSYGTTLGELAALVESFRDHRTTFRLPDFSQPFVRALYATYLSCLPPAGFTYALQVRSDARGSLAEFLKGPAFGQVFVSRTQPGVTRGNHYHHTKTEKFLVVHGEAVIRLRPVGGSEITSVRVRGEDFYVVDIPPGYTHSIENVGAGELVTLFWASEPFDPDRADTFARPVMREKGADR